MPIGRVLGYCSPRRIEGKVNPGRIVGKREARENGLYCPYPGPETMQWVVEGLFQWSKLVIHLAPNSKGAGVL